MESGNPGPHSRNLDNNGGRALRRAAGNDNGHDGGGNGGANAKTGGRGAKNARDVRLLAALARTIRAQRLSLNITQDALAKATGLDRSYIVSIEKGKRNMSVTKLVQLATVLGLSASQLMKLVEEDLSAKE